MSLLLFVQQCQIPLLYLTNIIGLGMKPGPFRVAVTLPILIFLVTQSFYRIEEMYYGDEYSMNCLSLCVVLMYLDWIILASPDKERWYKIRYGKKEGDSQREKDNIVPDHFFSRFWWGFRLATTNRYTGWSQQVKNVRMEVSADYPKWLFVVRKLLRAGLFFVFVDVLDSYTAASPHGSYRGHENGKVPVGFLEQSLLRQFQLSWIHILITYTSLELFNSLYAVASVVFGFANPRDCPTLFGDLQEMYTVRKAWSITWHQMMRRICSNPGIVLARDVLQLRKGSFASKYMQLFVTFFLSAVIHGGASMLANQNFEDYGAFKYFMLQAVVIMIEDHVIDFGQYLGFRDSMFWRIIGYTWTILWFGLATIEYSSGQINRGMWIHKKGPDLFGVGP
ncbi:membrane bound O-acyl transferase family-domain-containing protein [Clohesyomyces aquaticus]|uniref:Membrane bound O-acyl transferase family-domain-containing protein n=1 Tax=Clohesyomyces aquaticus TaxID=1231657 RepID=A0A1Y1ZCB8_9PLEO|nr:membrane bound O-acyl transferase family-domain-containing protein [Clohesyomyces aquaticus]